MQLRIDSKMARLGLDIQHPLVNLSSTSSKVELDTSSSRLLIESPRPQIHIDQTQCFADESHRNLSDFAAYCTNYSQSQFMEGLAKTVSDGDNLAAINKGFSIADLGAEAMEDNDDFEIVAVPGELPSISADVQPVSYNYTPSQVQVNVQAGQVENKFQWGRVQAYLTQQNALNIQWIDDSKVDIRG